jgi:hypothetical protein
MRRTLTLLTVLAIVAIGCGRLASDDPSNGAAAGGEPIDQRKIDVYEAVIRSLADTEGWFDPVLLDDRVCPGTGDPMSETGDPCTERFSDAEQAALLAALADLPGVAFVHDADRVTQRIFDGKLQGAGLLAVGPLDGDGDRVEVSGEAYCGGLCGHWMTLVVELRPEGWAVSGTTGPVAIS